jgi:hypothetical protein
MEDSVSVQWRYLCPECPDEREPTEEKRKGKRKQEEKERKSK